MAYAFIWGDNNICQSYGIQFQITQRNKDYLTGTFCDIQFYDNNKYLFIKIPRYLSIESALDYQQTLKALL